jgi:hypothetical protein
MIHLRVSFRALATTIDLADKGVWVSWAVFSHRQETSRSFHPWAALEEKSARIGEQV